MCLSQSTTEAAQMPKGFYWSEITNKIWLTLQGEKAHRWSISNPSSLHMMTSHSGLKLNVWFWLPPPKGLVWRTSSTVPPPTGWCGGLLQVKPLPRMLWEKADSWTVWHFSGAAKKPPSWPSPHCPKKAVGTVEKDLSQYQLIFRSRF